MRSALEKWPEYYLSVVDVTLSEDIVSGSDDDRWIGVLIDNIVLCRQADYFIGVLAGMKILWEAFFGDEPTFAPEQVHPHFVDLLPDIKTWLDSNPTKEDTGMVLLVADLEERRKLDEVFAWNIRN